MVPSKAKRNPVSGDHQVCFAWTTAAFAFTLLFASFVRWSPFSCETCSSTSSAAGYGRLRQPGVDLLPGGANANRRRESGTI